MGYGDGLKREENGAERYDALGVRMFWFCNRRKIVNGLVCTVHDE